MLDIDGGRLAHITAFEAGHLITAFGLPASRGRGRGGAAVAPDGEVVAAVAHIAQMHERDVWPGGV